MTRDMTDAYFMIHIHPNRRKGDPIKCAAELAKMREAKKQQKEFEKNDEHSAR